MAEVEQFSYSRIKNSLGEVALRPMVTATLGYRDHSLEAQGLLDTGADVNVLPYSLGIALGVYGMKHVPDLGCPAILRITKHAAF